MSEVKLELVVTVVYRGDEQVAIHEALGAIEGATGESVTDVTIDAWTTS